MSARPRIGELLISAGLLTQEQLATALEQQRAQGTGGRRLGQLLVELGFVTEVHLTKLLSQQLSVPWVSLHHIDFSRQLLNLVPHEIAEEFCLIPIYVRRERKAGDTLYLAMEDPTHDEAIRRVMAASGMPVKAMIAAPSDIRAAIRAFYGVGERAAAQADAPNPTPLPSTGGPPLAPPRAAPPPPPPVPKAPPPPPPHTRAPAATPAEPATIPTANTSSIVSPSPPALAPSSPVEALAPEPSPAPKPHESANIPISETITASATPPAENETHTRASAPLAPGSANGDPPARPEGVKPIKKRPSAQQGSPARSGPRMISLTLLDGTTIQIPAQKRRTSATESEPEPAPAGAEDRLTTRDLIAALRAVAGGADAAETLGDARWETLFAALLSLLMKKQLIADWEFVEEWQKM